LAVHLFSARFMSVLRPADEKELAEIVAASAARGEALELMAGGSKRGLGHRVEAAHALDLSGFAGIRLYEPEELVLTAGAATPLAEIEAALGAARQHLAFEPPDWGRLWGSNAAPTLGGTIAANLSGPRRVRDGAARDHHLGFRAVNGRGEVFKSGGRVVKNVTGYDLSKLMAGSFGTLAALTEVSVKVVPAPEETRTLILRGLDDITAQKAMAAALEGPYEASGAAHLPRGMAPDGEGAMTLLRLEGHAPSVAARAEAMARLLKLFAPCDFADCAESLRHWQFVRDAAAFANLEGAAIWRVSVAPSAGPRLVAGLAVERPLAHFYDWGGGLVWLAMAGGGDGGGAAIRAGLRRDGHATLIRGSEALRAAVPVFQPLAPALAALSARVKASFDPRNILNRGRMYSQD
jgi:glycolate dehydrogenase FAD-binding subunit